MKAIVTFEYATKPVSEVTVTVEDWQPPVEPHPTPEEKAACPKRFTCFVCGKPRNHRHLGGKVAEMWVCSICYPYVEARDVAWLEEAKTEEEMTKIDRLLFNASPEERRKLSVRIESLRKKGIRFEQEKLEAVKFYCFVDKILN